MDQKSTYLFCQAFMDPEEQVLWRGRPDRTKLYMPKYEFLAFLFGIGIAVVTAALMIFAWIVNGSDPIIVVFTIAFPGAGIFIVVYHIRRAMKIRDYTEYVITSKRIFRRIETRIDQFSEGIVDGYETKIHRNGNATIRFLMVIDPNAMRVRVNGREIIQTLALVNLTDAEAVQRALAKIGAPPA